MTELDPKISTLFAQPDMGEDPDFTNQVMKKVAQQQRRSLLKKTLVAVCVCSLLLLGMVHFNVAEFVAFSLTTPIFSIGEGWLNWILSPVNNIGALLVLLINFFRLARRGESNTRVSLLPF